MRKLCLNCMKTNHVLAGRCPYCRSERQGVWGRFFLVLGIIVACWAVYKGWI